MRFLEVVKIPYPKNQFLVILGSFSQRVNFSQCGSGFLLLAHSNKILQRKDDLFNSSQKKFFNFPQKYRILAIFGYLGPYLKSTFYTYKQSFEKIFGLFSGGGC